MASGPSYPNKIGKKKKKKKKKPSLQLYVLLIFEILKYSNWDCPSLKPFLEFKKINWTQNLLIILSIGRHCKILWLGYGQRAVERKTTFMRLFRFENLGLSAQSSSLIPRER
jgi:hypothetical protein